MSEEINNKKATEIYYPDADGPVKWSDDIPADGRRTLGEWLNKLTETNIEPVPTPAGAATQRLDISQHPHVNPSDIKTVYSDEGAGVDIKTDVVTYGPGGTASKLLLGDASSRAFPTDAGPYLDPLSTTKGIPLGKTSEVLAKNRFSPGQPFKVTDSWSNTQKLAGSGTSTNGASSFGAYNKDFDGLAMGELQDVAEQLLLNAVGDHKSGFGDKQGATINQGKGGFPFTTQLGVSRDSFDADQDFRPANAIQAARGGGRTAVDNINGAMPKNTAEEDLDENKSYKRTSFGVLNNHLEPFAPALPTSMILLAAVAAITAIISSIVLALIIDVLGAVVSLISGNGLGGGMSPDPTYQIYGDSNDPSKLSMGAAFGSNDHSDSGLWASIYRLFNLPPLEAEYMSFFYFTSAATIGSLEFFIGNSLGGTFMMPQILTNSAGYYVVVVRNALRDMEQISDAASDMGGGGVTGAIEGFFGLIDAFTSSSTFRFATTMIQIGDRIMTGPSLTPARNNNGRVIPDTLRENKLTPIIITDLGQTIRMKSGNRKLSYAFSVLPQIYLRPTETFAYHTLSPVETSAGLLNLLPDTHGLGDFAKNGVESSDVIISKGLNFAGADGVPAQFWNRLTYIEEGRIPTRFRQELENELNAYYMPFYFHDLRTNEIMPLPAFVSNISDSFSPKYSESTSFGRMDAVQIYGGTTRKIGFSFYMVATSPEDYSALYYGINKLVSLVYPQWGGGTEITNAAGEKFQVPYSYVQTASPLIRLRLGELFASNRTPETVRRLFGANLPSFSVPNKSKDAKDGIYPSEAPDETLTGDLNVSYITKAQFDLIRANGNAALINPDTSTLILATQIANAGGECLLYNSAGCSTEGGYEVTGGATDKDGISILLPTGVIVNIKPGITIPAVEWGGISYKKSRKGVKGSRTFDEPTAAKIVNYYMRGAPRTAPGTFPLGGYLKNKLYYVVELVIPSNPAPEFPYLIVPIESVDWAPADDSSTGGSSVQFLPNPIPVPPIPGAPPPEEAHTDYQFFEKNVIVAAMEESGGDGIAGVITSLDFDWNEAPWETDMKLGRAPKYVKVTLSFSPIHDEPLGLNPDGSLRAAAYPVGDVINSVMGERFGLPGRLGRNLSQNAIKIARQIIADAGLPPDTETPPAEI